MDVCFLQQDMLLCRKTVVVDMLHRGDEVFATTSLGHFTFVRFPNIGMSTWIGITSVGLETASVDDVSAYEEDRTEVDFENLAHRFHVVA